MKLVSKMRVDVSDVENDAAEFFIHDGKIANWKRELLCFHKDVYERFNHIHKYVSPIDGYEMVQASFDIEDELEYFKNDAKYFNLCDEVENTLDYMNKYTSKYHPPIPSSKIENTFLSNPTSNSTFISRGTLKRVNSDPTKSVGSIVNREHYSNFKKYLKTIVSELHSYDLELCSLSSHLGKLLRYLQNVTWTTYNLSSKKAKRLAFYLEDAIESVESDSIAVKSASGEIKVLIRDVQKFDIKKKTIRSKSRIVR
jgi:hypothetical protein